MKYLIRAAVATLALGVLSGCANTEITPGSIGGSKADAIIIMGATHRAWTNLDWHEANEEAERRCKAWGYYGAEPFDVVNSKCESKSAFGCSGYTSVREFQCLHH